MTGVPYTQNIDSCFEETIGEGGLKQSVYRRYLDQTRPVLDDLRQKYQRSSLPLLRVPEDRDDLERGRQVLETFLKDTSDLVVFGIGGSSLGAEALAQITGWGTAAHQMPHPAPGRPRVHIFDNLDGESLASALDHLDLRTTRFLVVSKSGSTAETLIQMLTAMSAIDAAGGGKYMKYHFAVLTEPAAAGRKNPLRDLAERHGFPILDHHPGVGGRFAVLTNVGLVPAMAMGLDAVRVREGAASVLQSLLHASEPDACAPAVGAAMSIALTEQRQVGSSVLFAYADRLSMFGLWYRQLWAESLGKEGKGTVPIRALGPVDQHSQLQLYLGGPNDKFFTVLMTEAAGRGPKVDPKFADDPSLAYLAGHTIGNLVDAEQRATADTLARNGRPTRIMRIPAIDERTMGGLFMHFMLETIIAARLLDVDAFDQPAVEEGKVLARKYLGDLER